MTGSGPATPGDVTSLLLAWRQGDRSAMEKLVPLVYAELRDRARRALAKERSNHTLQPTALVNEVYLRLVDQSRVEWQNRSHFFAVAARAMREVLVDHARRRLAAKRDAGRTLVPFSRAAAQAATPPPNLDVLALEIALERLGALDERQARLVELRVYGGLTIEESAEVLAISPATVSREWRHAEAWLHREMSGR
jgi:RNA polymerase sigma factor (TIGR02999 family)